jgi:hypothetical protein
MDSSLLSRRQFLKLSSFSLLGVGFSSPRLHTSALPFAIGRVATPKIYVYSQPSFKAERVDDRFRDQLINLLEEVQSPDGPLYNPLWYRMETGFVHSGHVQRIEFKPPNQPLEEIPEGGLFGQVTVPYTRTFYKGRGSSWKPLYRLYYYSVHWIQEVCKGSAGVAWYRLFDPKNDSEYFVPAADLRPLPSEEYSPIGRDVARDDKRIVVSIEEQSLTAYEKDKIVLQTRIASGVPSAEPPPEGEPPTDTPIGTFRVSLKMPSRHMGDGRLTDQIDAYELPGVPWAMAFHEDGYALHGSYWHNNFGRPMSHGCINMRNVDALWLFRWSDPVYESKDWYVKGLGTLINII